MGKSKPIVLPKLQQLMDQVGEQIRLARLRRKLSADQLAERTGISRRTIYSIEKGSPSVSIGYYLNVLRVLGLESDILNLAKDDKLGRKLQDAGLITKNRAPKKH
ncbi:helix-turn-helix transcriptional regulator [Algoriphagus sp. D3-2-R+10]|uniref:helix-turn-helix domain-containing protein n=1 Tax=Algoriphagus aurantiacus TaxID=3103948 RepID=UPI002B3B9D2D|nr:helix-turn-helix transcriptional regulator [Algoriphagus sp. D3-2-R+10]MEB2774630.1 helix-turn-helix transcriptional regulator [Algoriphagus sp. D3-2-R+10]